MTSSNTGTEFWSGEGGRRWLKGEAFTARAVAAFGADALRAAAPQPRERALDVGCGTGATTIELARAVGGDGHVVGIDVSADLLVEARRRAAAVGARNLSFVEADAASHELGENRFDLLYSRFGVMFFADPTAAFANLRRAMRSDGRLAFVCWTPFKENPWALVAYAAAAQHLPALPPLGPEDPGPYSFGDPDRVRRILGGSGWNEIRLELVEHPIALAAGGGVEEALSFCGSASPVSRLLADAPEAGKTQALAAVRAALAPYETADGRIELLGRCWLVTARA
jgi:SAM-dependent methyltransferase